MTTIQDKNKFLIVLILGPFYLVPIGIWFVPEKIMFSFTFTNFGVIMFLWLIYALGLMIGVTYGRNEVNQQTTKQVEP